MFARSAAALAEQRARAAAGGVAWTRAEQLAKLAALRALAEKWARPGAGASAEEMAGVRDALAAGDAEFAGNDVDDVQA